jgi:methane/ammonia monooxygenase subunit C
MAVRSIPVRPEGSSERALHLVRRGEQFRWMGFFAGGVFAILIFWRVWQILFQWKYGLDATSADYRHYWMGLFWVDQVVLALGGAAWIAWLAKGCKTCRHQQANFGAVLPDHEVTHIWRSWAMVAGFAVSFLGFAQFAENDGVYHQIAVRDTAFTPSHILLFWGAGPLAIILSNAIYAYAVTRIPRVYAKGVPLSFMLFLAGNLMLLVWVAFNEWGHSFWVAEETFSVPLHWGFFLFAWLSFGVLALFIHTVPRLVEIADAAMSSGGDDREPMAAGEVAAGQ